MACKVNLTAVLVLSLLTVSMLVVVLPSAAMRLAQVPPEPTIEFAQVWPTADVPVLSPEQKQRAVSLTLELPLIQGIVAGRTYTATVEAPWVTDEGLLVGCNVKLQFSPAGTFVEDWPQGPTSIEGGGLPVYPIVYNRYRLVDASDLNVMVDLRGSGFVAQVLPGFTGYTLPEPTPTVP